MNQIFRRSFTAAVLMCAVGMPLAARAEQISDNAHATLQETSGNIAEQLDPSASEVHSPDTARLEPDMTGLSDRFRITTHTLEGRDIAILYIGYMPVLTFVDVAEDATSEEEGGLTGQKERQLLATADIDPAYRAEDAARRLDEFYQSESDPNTILVRWDDALEEYVVSLGEEDFVAVNDATIYFNTTGEHAADALQATNRIRGLLGAAEPLTTIEGQPEPEPEPEAAALPEWGVVSSFSGEASWYGPGFHGRRTASGETFNQNSLTAAHRTLPFGTRVRVTNLNNNRYVVVRINDRGPFTRGRVIDLSAAAAREIGLDRAGVGPVRVEVLSE